MIKSCVLSLCSSRIRHDSGSSATEVHAVSESDSLILDDSGSSAIKSFAVSESDSLILDDSGSSAIRKRVVSGRSVDLGGGCGSNKDKSHAVT